MAEQKAVRTEQYLYVTYEKRKKPALYDITKDRRTLHNIIGTDEGKKALPELERLMKNYREGMNNGR